MPRPRLRDRLAFALATHNTGAYAATMKASDVAGYAYRTVEHYLTVHARDDLNYLTEKITERLTGEPTCADCLLRIARADAELYAWYLATEGAGKAEGAARALGKAYDQHVWHALWFTPVSRGWYTVEEAAYALWSFCNDSWIAAANRHRFGGRTDWTPETVAARWGELRGVAGA